MASDNEASCESDPNFAVVCAFLEKFGATCGLPTIDFLALQQMLENSQEVPQELIDLHIKLLRKSRKTVSIERWERAIIKFCHTFSSQDAWEIERFGYKKARITAKLRVLKELLELQFDFNVRFKAEINKMSAMELRSEPLGKDKHGHLYWYQFDNNCQIRIYKEDPDEETWTLVAKDRDGWVNLINDLSDGDSKISSESTNLEEDSNSLAEKPIIDTGQGDSSSSDQIKDDKPDIIDQVNISSQHQQQEMDENAQSAIESNDKVNNKRALEVNDENDAKKMKQDVEISEAIEEPLMLVKGVGAGADNNAPNDSNPIIGETIEEDVIYFYGVGDGACCQTGNENDGSKSTHQSVEQTNKQSELLSNSSENKNNNSENSINTDSKTSTPSASCVKNQFKLGTIIDTKTDNKLIALNDKSPTKKSSRWDVASMLSSPTCEKDTCETKPAVGRVKELVNKWEQQQTSEQQQTNVEVAASATPKKPMFFFGPGCLQFKATTSSPSTATMGFGQKVPKQTSDENLSNHKNDAENSLSEDRNKKGDIGYRIEKSELSETLKSLESQIITAADEIDHVSLNENIPKVTAALVEDEIDERKEKSTNIDKKSSINDDDSNISNPILTAAQDNLGNDETLIIANKVDDNGPELVPIVEDVCVKKTAYKLGPLCDNEEKSQTISSNLIVNDVDTSKNQETVSISEITNDHDDNKSNINVVKDEISSCGSHKDKNPLDESIKLPYEDLNASKVIEDEKKNSNNATISEEKGFSDQTTSSVDNKIETEKEETQNSVIVKEEECPNQISEVKKVTKDPSKGFSVNDLLNIDETSEKASNDVKSEDSVISKIETATISDEQPKENLTKIIKPAEIPEKVAEKIEPSEKPKLTVHNIENIVKEKDATPHTSDKSNDIKLEIIEKTQEQFESTKQLPEKQQAMQDIKENIPKESISIDSKESEKELACNLSESSSDLNLNKLQVEQVETKVLTKEDLADTPPVLTKENDKVDLAENLSMKKMPDELPPVLTVEDAKEEKSKDVEELIENKQEINVDDNLQQNKRGRISPAKNDVDLNQSDSKKMKLSSEENRVEVAEKEIFVPSPPASSNGSIGMAEPLIDHNDNDNSNEPIEEEKNQDKLEEKDEEKSKPAMSLANFSLDFVESPVSPSPSRALRKRGHESPIDEDVDDTTAGKRIKIKGKRSVDVALRKSIEEQKNKELISSDDDNIRSEQVDDDDDDVSDEDKSTTTLESTIATTPKSSSKKSKKKGKKKKEKMNADGTIIPSVPRKPKNPANKNKRLLTNLGINPDQPLDLETEVIGVRQSRRIAQLKIKEEAERRKLEEETQQELLDMQKKKKSKKDEDKDYKMSSEKRKSKVVGDDVEVEDDSNDSKKHKKKKKKSRKLFDELNPWRSSSDSSSNEEDEIGEEEEEEDEELNLQYVSDHEFSPESDLEGDGEPQPLKRARTVRKESADVDDDVDADDCPCQKCGKSDHPEWILLCDRCDNGWHCSCLRPPLLVIPEGDWFCPPCQHVRLLQNLQEKLKDYDKQLNKKLLEDRRKERLAYVGISLNNVLPATELSRKKQRQSSIDSNQEDSNDDEDDDEEDRVDDGGEVAIDDDDGSSSSSEEESGTHTSPDSDDDSDEPIYQLRQRRQAHSYRFNDYDELINSAIQDEMEAVKGAGNQGRGKDIATIVNAKEGEEGGETAAKEEIEKVEPLPPILTKKSDDVDDKHADEEDEDEEKPVYSDDEPIVRVKKKLIGKKKHRKLNALDVSSDDSGSDEDFKGSSADSDEDFEEDFGSEDSDDFEVGGRNRRKGNNTVRRSTRARTSRYDADFIDDGDSEEDEDTPPRRKKKRSIWDESESEESDRSWGRRKRKPTTSRSKRTPAATASATTLSKKKKPKKKKKKNEDSDAEVYKKKKPKIKFGGDDEQVGSGRRTRGKKINYVDALGSDSDEDRVKRQPPRIESEEEYVANEEEEDEEEKVSDEEQEQIKQQQQIPKIQSFADANFTKPLPEGIPTPKNVYVEEELNPIAQINKNLEEMDENEMEKMMEEEEYANKQLQLVALQIEKEKKRKEREAKKFEMASAVGAPTSVIQSAIIAEDPLKKQQQQQRGRKKNQFPFGSEQIDNLMLNTDNNDELSAPPGVNLPSFSDFETVEDDKKRRGRGKKVLEEALQPSSLVRQQEPPPSFMVGLPPQPAPIGKQHSELLAAGGGPETNIEIAAPPQPFSQSQPTPSVITRMLQNKPGQPGYPVGTIRPKQFATLNEREAEEMSHLPPGQYLPPVAGMRPQLGSPYRPLPPNMNHYPRGVPPPPHQIRNPMPPQSIPPHIYHTHRPMDPSPSGGGPISLQDHHNSPGRVVSPASSSPGSNKNETTPPPPYVRSPVVTSRFPLASAPGGGVIPSTSPSVARHLHMVGPPASHLQAQRPSSLSPYHPSLPPYHYGQFGPPPPPPPIGGAGGVPPVPPDDGGIPPSVVYQSGAPYGAEQFAHEAGGVPNSGDSNSKGFDEEGGGGEFGGLVSYFSSQREDDLES